MGPVLDGGDSSAAWSRTGEALVGKVEAIKARLRPDQRDAYFQLVEYPVLAFSNLYEMYYAAAWNRGWPSRTTRAPTSSPTRWRRPSSATPT
jgi:hypothetical protein